MASSNSGRARGVARALTVALACAVALACGTVLDVSPDEPLTSNGDGGNKGDGAQADVDTVATSDAGDGGTTTPVQLGDLTFTVEPAVVDVLAGGGVANLTVKVTRPPGNTAPVQVAFSVSNGLTIPLVNPFTGATGTTTVAASGTAAPLRMEIDVIATSGPATASAKLVVRIARELRAAGDTAFTPTTDQTFGVTAWGAGGAASNGGGGGFVAGFVSAKAGEPVLLQVGAPGTDTGVGGAPGGGAGGTGTASGGGGGGYSGVFVTVAGTKRSFLVAGGGGGGSSDGIVHRGGGGGSSANNLSADTGQGPQPGLGASATAPGSAGGTGQAGTSFAGGAGAMSSGGNGGGGGGGGFNGGGGGGPASGGGGGASQIPNGGTGSGGTSLLPGNSGDVRRMNAGSKGSPGALIVTPQ